MGEGTLDLSDLGMLRGPTRRCEPRSASATSSCWCPRTRTLVVDTEVGAGEAVVFGEQQNGVGFETHDRHPGEGGTLTLDLEVGMGQIEVRRVLDRTTGRRPADTDRQHDRRSADGRATTARRGRRGRCRRR